jgi:hypothetical protein
MFFLISSFMKLFSFQWEFTRPLHIRASHLERIYILHKFCVGECGWENTINLLHLACVLVQLCWGGGWENIMFLSSL